MTTKMVTQLPRGKSVNVTHLEDMLDQALRSPERDVSEIVLFEKMIAESGDELEPIE